MKETTTKYARFIAQLVLFVLRLVNRERFEGITPTDGELKLAVQEYQIDPKISTLHSVLLKLFLCENGVYDSMFQCHVVKFLVLSCAREDLVFDKPQHITPKVSKLKYIIRACIMKEIVDMKL